MIYSNTLTYSEDTPKKALRTAHWLPNVFTVGNLALGFFAIVSTIEQKLTQAATCILLGHVCDILDGRVARWTKTTSRFGVEFDSLADWLSFGVAPAILIYNVVLQHYKLGWLLCLLFVLCGALRLARFNITAQTGETSLHFTGLPIPVAGGLLAVMVLLYDTWAKGEITHQVPLLMKKVPVLYQAIPVVVFGLAILMVSRLPYSSLKKTNFLRPRSLRALLATIFAGFMIYTYPQSTIFVIYLTYILWGLADTTFRKIYGFIKK